VSRDLVDETEAATYLGDLPVRTLRQWRYVGRGPRYVKVERHVRYRISDLDRWLDANTVQPGIR
jgi:Helix-turn-helix domain